MKVLVIDVGGTHVKILATGQKLERRMDSSPTLTARQMVSGVRALARGWKYDVVSIGFPGPVLRNRPVSEPYNLGKGWVDLDYDAALGCPVKMVNDAAMQALGSYEGGKMLFLGLGTGLGSTLIVDDVIVPMELAHLPYRNATFEDYVGKRGLDRYGKKRWRRYVADAVERLIGAFEPDDVVLGGGNVANLSELPPRCRLGSNANAFTGGFRLWSSAPKRSGVKTKTKRTSTSRGR
jgi:polyphosphate glucokinase